MRCTAEPGQLRRLQLDLGMKDDLSWTEVMVRIDAIGGDGVSQRDRRRDRTNGTRYGQQQRRARTAGPIRVLPQSVELSPAAGKIG